MRKKTFIGACLAALSLAAVPLSATAQNYPTRAIKLIVPFAAGSATILVARILGSKMSETLGQPIIVENMAGASGVIAAQNVARAASDGYTVLITSNTTHAANQSMLKKVSYDAVTDFEPITKLGTVALALIVNPSVPASNVQELLTYAKANPGKLTFGSGTSSSRIAGEMLKTLGGIDVLNVPYRSTPQAITDILGGQISLVFADIWTTLPQVKAGTVKGLAISTAQRSKLAPELPTMAEAGVPGYDLSAWSAAFVPAKTPKPIVEKLHAAFTEALSDKAIQEQFSRPAASPSEHAGGVEGVRDLGNPQVGRYREGGWHSA